MLLTYYCRATPGAAASGPPSEHLLARLADLKDEIEAHLRDMDENKGRQVSHSLTS